MTAADLGGLLQALGDARIRFVVIGGIAVAAHASIRSIEDLDIVPDPAPENSDDLANLLVQLDARLLRDPARSIDVTVRRALHAHLVAMKRARGAAIDFADLENLEAGSGV